MTTGASFWKTSTFLSQSFERCCAISATVEDFPDLFPDHSDRTRSFSMELSRALLQHAMHASWRYEHLTEDYLMLIDVDISMDNTMMNGEKYYG